MGKRFESYHWHVQDIGDKANDLAALADALSKAKEETERPSLIIVRSHIGYGSPNRQDTAKAHGEPLGEEEVKLTKKGYGWPEDRTFFVPDEVLVHMRLVADRGVKLEEEWNKRFSVYEQVHPDLAAQLKAALNGRLPWEQALTFYRKAFVLC